MTKIIKWLFIKWLHAPILILYVIYSFVGQCIFLCKVKMLLYISLVPFVKRNVSYFHCSIIVSLYYTVAYYSEELVKKKDVAKPQIFEGNETEGSARHLTKKTIYIHAYIYTLYHERSNLPILFCMCKIFLLFWKIFLIVVLLFRDVKFD